MKCNSSLPDDVPYSPGTSCKRWELDPTKCGWTRKTICTSTSYIYIVSPMQKQWPWPRNIVLLYTISNHIKIIHSSSMIKMLDWLGQVENILELG